MVKKVREYFIWERESLKASKEFIERKNRLTLIMLLIAMVAAYAGLLVFSLCKVGYSSLQLLFAFMLFYMGACLVFVWKTPVMPVNHLVYGVYIVTVLLCIYATAFVDPDYVNGEAYVFFLLFPILYTDLSWRIDLVSLVLFVLYLYNIFSFKTGKALALEATNIICFSFLGLFIGHFVRWKNLKFTREAEGKAKIEFQEVFLGLPNHRKLIQDLRSKKMIYQAVAVIKVEELCSPLVSFGLDFQRQQLRQLGEALTEAAKEQGIDLYCCGCGIVGLMQPRILDGVFQRLEPLHHVLKHCEFYRQDGKVVKLHFGIGAALLDKDLEAALEKAFEVCIQAQGEGGNRILVRSE